MINERIEIYPTLEITTNKITFSVAKFINGKIFVIFKNEKLFINDILNEYGVIKDIRDIQKNLLKIINEYEKNYNGSKIEEISLIFPSTKVFIGEKYEEINITENNEVGKITKEIITDLKNKSRKESIKQNYKIIETKSISWRVDGQPIELNKIQKLEGHKVGSTFRTFEIPYKVYESHMKVIQGCNKRVIYKSLNIDSLYHSVALNIKIPRPMVIVNWKASIVEVGFYENGGLINYKVINKGINDIKNKISKTLNMKEKITDEYLFSLNDYSSSLNDNVYVYQKWNNNTKILNRLLGKDLKLLVQNEIQNIYKEAKQIAKNYLKVQNNIAIYNFGEIRNISGVEQILKNGSSIANDFVYDEFILGLRNTIGFEGIIGNIKIIEKLLINKLEQTSIKTVQLVDNSNEQTITRNRNLLHMVGKNQKKVEPQYLLNERILVDSIEKN